MKNGGKLLALSLGIPALFAVVAGSSLVPTDIALFQQLTMKCDRCFSADISPAGKQLAFQSSVIDRGPLGKARGFFWAVKFWDIPSPELSPPRVISLEETVTWDPHTPAPVTQYFIRYSPDGRFLLGLEGAGRLCLLALEGTQVRVLRAIDLGMSPARPTLYPVDLQWSPDGKRAAVLLSWKSFHEGTVRVYSVESGELSWERSFNRVEMGNAAWSPDGKKLAVTLLSGSGYDSLWSRYEMPAHDIPNLLILDSATGLVVQQIRTKDQAGPICFAPDGSVLTAPVHLQLQSRNPLRPEKVKVWDLGTGKLMREIGSPGRDVHNDIELSKDGTVLLAYVGNEKWGPSWKAMGEAVQEIKDERFQLFDYRTGKLVATSPDLRKPDQGCADHPPSFRLSARGDRVLAYWPFADCSPTLFEEQVARTP